MVFSILVFGIILSVIFGLFVFVAKIKFAKEIFSAKVDVNVFNHSLALCFIASGLNGIALSVNNIKNIFSGVGTMIYLPCTVWLIGINYGHVSISPTIDAMMRNIVSM